MDPPSTNRRSDAVVMRSAEDQGFGPRPDPGAQSSARDRSTSDEAERGIDAANEPSGPASTGPRYDSLVTYEKGADQPREGDSEGTDQADDDVLSRRLETIPAEPGVYLLKDKNGKVLYVGKAKSLRPRVRAYFRDGGDGRFQVRFLMRRVRDFDTLVAHSEKEALILENNLIKQYKPRYNIRLKDDKSY